MKVGFHVWRRTRLTNITSRHAEYSGRHMFTIDSVSNVSLKRLTGWLRVTNASCLYARHRYSYHCSLFIHTATLRRSRNDAERPKQRHERRIAPLLPTGVRIVVTPRQAFMKKPPT
jgi:hypothetical protein